MTTRLPSKPGDGSSFAHNQGSPNQFCRIQGAGPGHVSKRIDRHTARSASARWRQLHQPPAAATSQPRMQASTVTHSRKRELQERSSPKPAMANKPCRLNTGPAARSKNSDCRPGYRFSSSLPYRSHEPAVFSRSCRV